MNIEKWIKENTDWLVDEEDIQVVPVSDLRELLKSHAIVPREPSDEKLKDWKSSSLGLSTKQVYNKAIEVMEKE